MRSLYAKLSLVLLALFCATTALYLVLTLVTTRIYVNEVTQKLNRNLAATISTEKPLMRGGRINQPMLHQVFDMLMAVNPNIEIYLLDSSGKILGFSAPPGKVKRTSVSIEPIHRFLIGGRLPIEGDDPRDLRRKKIFSAAPLEGGGFLYVILGGEHYDSVAQQLRGSYFLQLSVAIGVAGVIFAFAAGLLLFGGMTRPLRMLASSMDAFKQSDFTEEAKPTAPRVRGQDEVARLAQTFDEMAERIILQVQKLKEIDLLRRELIANVSHDLRTPLASLQGYLDTLLLKEGQLTHDEQRRFLEIASRHSERLGRLVTELFELAKLDSQMTPIKVEPFSMQELVQDVVQKFQLRAEQGKVRLAADVVPDLPLASGDIALMERVLENLIENAIRHTPAEGEVTVSVRRENGRLTVSVADTGSGIAPEHLPHIFDRFYTAGDASARSGGAGLGLAIARRILELHGTVLVAESRVNEGTTFVFQPPVAA